MAFPLIPGDNPETEIVTADQWNLVAQGVRAAKVHNLYQSEQLAYITYLKAGEAAPITLESVPYWKIPESYAEFKDSITPRDLYVYPVSTDAKITVEA